MLVCVSDCGYWENREGGFTFHDAGLVDRELESFFANLNVGFGGEGDATKEQVQLASRAGHCRENWRVFGVHVARVVLRRVLWYKV